MRPTAKIDSTATRRARVSVAAALVAAALGAIVADAHALDPELEKGLAASKYVYIASQRKDGTFGKPAEIWFLHHDGAVWVASPATTWRAKRIRAGRTKARIAVGRPDGPSFAATGAIVKDEAATDAMFRTFATKYPDGWSKFEQRFRDGLKDGSRVLIRYRPS